MSGRRMFGRFEWVQDHFEMLLLEILEDEKEALSAEQIETQLEVHPEFNIKLRRRELSRWLAKASDDLVVTHPQIGWRYVARLDVPAEEGTA